MFFKPALTFGLGILTVVGAFMADTQLTAAPRVTVLSPQDAAAIEGAVCPIVPILGEDVCHGANVASSCAGGGWSGCTGSCAVDCVFSASKRATSSGGLDIRTRPCMGAVESPPRQCTTVKPNGSQATCTVPFFWWSSCYCDAPYGTAACGAANFTEFDTCN